MKSRMKRVATGLAALLVAGCIWLPCLHFFFARPVSRFRPPQGLSAKASQLAARHLQLWTEPALREVELKKMRASNAEWDFMGRSYLVWSLANMASASRRPNRFTCARWTRSLMKLCGSNNRKGCISF